MRLRHVLFVAACGAALLLAPKAGAINHALLTGGSNKAPPVVAFQSSGTTNGGTYALGAAAAGKIGVAALSMTGPSGNSISAVLICGVAASQSVSRSPGGSASGDYAAIWSALVPSCTSGVVSVTYSGSITALGISVYSMTGIASVVPNSTGSGSFFGPGTAPTISASISVPANGVVIGIDSIVRSGGSSTNWTNLTKNADFATLSSVSTSAASAGPLGASTLTVSAASNPNSAVTTVAMAAASWSP